jgi:allantoin racemase
MRIKIINPNTSQGFTDRNLAVGRAVCAAGTEILASQPSHGAVSVECHVDEAIATLGVIEAVQTGETEGVDGYVIACFGDTGLGAAREVAAGPVVGMTEAALYAAAMIAPVFSIITLPRRSKLLAERAIWAAGMERRCGAIRAIDVDVLDCEDEAARVYDAFVAEARLAIAEDRAEAIIIGCAGLEPMVEALKAELGVPIIEGVSVAVKMAEALVGLGLRTSKSGAFGYPVLRTAPPEGVRLPDDSPSRNRVA